MLLSLQKLALFEHNSSIKAICNPINKIGIDGFFFIRYSYKDNSCIDLSNNLPWSEHFLQNYLQEKYDYKSISDHIFIHNNISLWSINHGNEVWQEGFQYFDLKEGVSIIQAHQEWRDIFGFYILQKNKLGTMELIGLLEYLKRFCDYFLEKASSIITAAEKTPLLTPKKYSISHNTMEKQKKSSFSFFNKLFEDNESLDLNGFKELTLNELSCIRFASKGLSSIQIGEKMNLSSRTVETYILNARNKTGCRNLVELVCKYFQLKDFLAAS